MLILGSIESHGLSSFFFFFFVFKEIAVRKKLLQHLTRLLGFAWQGYFVQNVKHLKVRDSWVVEFDSQGINFRRDG